MFDLVQVLCLPTRCLARSHGLPRWIAQARQLHAQLWLLCAALGAAGVLALVHPVFPGYETIFALVLDLFTVTLFTVGSRRLLRLEALDELDMEAVAVLNRASVRCRRHAWRVRAAGRPFVQADLSYMSSFACKRPAPRLPRVIA